MSAYVVDKRHIVFLVKAAISHRLAEIDGGSIRWGGTLQNCIRTTATPAEIASVCNMLLSENVASVNAKYRDNDPAPVITSRDVAAIRFDDFDPVQVLKSVHCYEYQSCEHEGWEASNAHSFAHQLKKKAIHALPGYDDAEWGAPK
jgi:hypothetical protein